MLLWLLTPIAIKDVVSEFPACAACFMHARTPGMRRRGLRDECAGAAASRARKGSRAQARRDLERGLLPAPRPKKAFGALVAPTAEVRSRWAEKLGLAADGDLGASAAANTRAAQDGEDERPARRQRTSTAAAGGSPGASAADGVLIMPPAESVAAAICGLRLRFGRGGACPRGGGSLGESGRSRGRACVAQNCIEFDSPRAFCPRR
ncbi:unnamed protein product, partial [Prorocentrum cordatum]